jgi:hypothetical protein
VSLLRSGTAARSVLLLLVLVLVCSAAVTRVLES